MQLTGEYQAISAAVYPEHVNGVDASPTPEVPYGYSDLSDGNGSRLTEMVYPNGRENGTKAVEGASHLHHK